MHHLKNQNDVILYAVGRIRKSFGVKGFVNVEPLTHSLKRFRKLNEVYVGTNAESASLLSIEQVTLSQKSVRVKFRTVDDKTGADRLAGNFLFVDERTLEPPPKGSHFIHDIVGCTVWMNNKPIGIVVEVYTKAQGFAQDVWVIESSDPNYVGGQNPDGIGCRQYARLYKKLILPDAKLSFTELSIW